MTTPKKAWNAIGRSFNIERNQIEFDEDIEIQEEVRSVNMDLPLPAPAPADPNGEAKDPYGIPIDANLAIFLIQKWLTLLDEKNLDPVKLIETKENFTGLTALESTLVDLLKRSLGITFDKNMLLKILSQPDCEGMRFYVCFTPNVSEQAETDHVVSLVMVGVDKYGRDLHYQFEGTIQENGNESIQEQPNIDTKSLIAEYGHPPGSGENKGYPDYDKERYVLLGYALEEHKKKSVTVNTVNSSN